METGVQAEVKQMLEKDNIKQKGRVYTPEYLVNIILDYVGYNGDCLLKKHIIDNSCGDGAFLIEIVKRYCNIFNNIGIDNNVLKNELETYIHGIEIDKTEFEKCCKNLDKLVLEYGLNDVKWDIVNADTLTVSKYNNKMDYVVGNPPYVRVHNLNENFNLIKNFKFTQTGMTDLFLVFIEIGFNMMSENGKMCVITPSSWLNSVAGKCLRNYIIEKQCLNGVIDLEHFQPFEVATYTLISRYSFKKSETVEYNTFNSNSITKEFCCNIPLNEMNIDNVFYIGDRKTLQKLREIRLGNYPKKVCVKNGFVTSADNVFIGENNFSGITIDVIKSSTGNWYKCIFPYDEYSKELSITEIKNKYIDVYNYLLKNKNILSKGNRKKDWYLFSRTQGIKDVQKDKISINYLIKDVSDVKLFPVKKGKGVFGGMYILSSDYKEIESIVRSEDFVNYIKALKKYKSGGYYTYSSKDVEIYINYKLFKLKKNYDQI